MPIDYSKYHPEWKDRIRPDILKRASFKCELCGVRHKAIGYRQKDGTFVECDEFMQEWCKREGIKTIRIILTIMHLDHTITNNEYTNLKAGCQRCHLRYDQPHKALLRKAKLASQS